MKGNDSITTARKTHLLESLAPAFGAKRVGIFHEASASDTGIDLTNLNIPSTYLAKGYSNPSDANIQAMRISYFKNNIKIISSDRGTLTIGDYDIPSNTQINFDGFTANANEIFEIWFEPSIIGGATVVEARPLVKSYVLPEGETDVVVEPFEINRSPLEQIGAVMVFRGPTMNLQFRNSGNAAASASADGNYEEVKGTGGLTSLIRFNVPAAVGGENVVVVSVGSLMERPTQSMISYLENMNGDVDKIRDTIAALSGQPKSNFNGQPQTVDLATFGERFNAILNTEINTLVAEDVTSFVPTGSWTTNVTYTGKRSRMGENMLLRMRVSCSGTPGPAATTLNFNMPTGFTVDTSKLTYAHVLISGSTSCSVGRIPFLDCEVSGNIFYPRIIDNPNTAVHNTTVPNSTSGIPGTYSSGHFANLVLLVPIVGWQMYETKTLKELAGL